MYCKVIISHYTDLHEMTHSVSSVTTAHDGPTGNMADYTVATHQQVTQSNS